MKERLIGRDATGINKFLHKGVVFGDLANLAIAQEINARVADVCNGNFVVDKHQRRASGAHAR